MKLRSTKTGRPSSRHGLTLIEITVAVFLLAVSMTLTVRVIGWVAVERRACERRQCATREASNIMERLTALPWDRITAETAKGLALSERSVKGLPAGELNVAVDEPPDSGSRRISIRIRWRNRGGEWDAPVRLTAWVYRAGSQSR